MGRLSAVGTSVLAEAIAAHGHLQVTRSRISRIAQSVTEQVEGKNNDEDRHAWHEHVPRIDTQTTQRVIDHATPRRRWR